VRVPVLVAPLAALALAAAGCGDDGGDIEAFCATARRFATDNPASVFDRYDPTDPGSAAVLLRDAGDRLAAWAEDAPSRIDDDVQAIADAAVALATEFEEPDAASSETLQEQLLEVESASARVLEFTRAECDVDLEPAATTVSG
jgi:hypothetical protein